MKKYTLIFPMAYNTTDLGGYFNSNIDAHAIHVKRYGSVYINYAELYYAPGVIHRDKRKIQHSFKNDSWNVYLNKKGYFYTKDEHNITYSFKIKSIILEEDLRKDLKKHAKFIPPFRMKAWIEKKKNATRPWLKITDIKKVTSKVVSRTRKNKNGIVNKYVFPRIKYPKDKCSLSTNHLRRPCLVHLMDSPRVTTYNVENTYKYMISDFLIKRKNLKENDITMLFLYKLMNKGYIIYPEKPIDSEYRPDFLLKKGRRKYIIEFKRSNPLKVVDKIANYIRRYEKIHGENINGKIVVSRVNKELQKKAEKKGIECLEFCFKFEIPNI